MKFFLMGIIFGCVISPILDGLTSLVLSFVEMVKSYINVKIVSNGHKMGANNEECTSTNAIGFVYNGEVEEEDDGI